MRLGIATAFAITLAVASTAHADGNIVLSGGPELGVLDTPGTQLPNVQTGLFLHLAITPGIPRYTTQPRGYRWRTGLSGELLVRGGQVDNNREDRYQSAALGLRYDISFSQRRMGLLQVSGRGGFYFAARAGVIKSDSLAQPGYADVGPVVPDGGGAPRKGPAAMDAPANQRIGSFVVGTYVLLGDSLRLGTEVGAFAIGYSKDVDPRSGMVMRVSLGASL